jgi:cytidine deaminase
MSLTEAAWAVRENAYVPYSKFKVGVALRAASGAVFVGCNVENAAYPEGTCAEAGAIAAMVAAGETRLVEVVLVGDTEDPISPCGGCRQKLSEFGAPDVPVLMLTRAGRQRVMSIAELLPGGFTSRDMDPA